MGQLGKTIFKQLTNEDIPQIEKFCELCEKLGYENNNSLKAMKFDSAVFFGAFDNNELFSLAGVHKLPEIDEHAYRCLFRGAQLPRYTPQWSMNIFKSGIHFSQFLYRQIKFIQNIDSEAEFYISTNIHNPSAGASTRLNNVMMPRLAEKGYCSLAKENFQLYNTSQNLWKVNVIKYMEARELWLSGDMNTD
jgi:hypothetical protein